MPLNYTSVEKVLVLNASVGSVTTINSAVISSVAGQAEALVDAKLARLYTVPVAGRPPLLESISSDLTLYRLMSRRMLSGESANDSPWPDRYKEAMELLDQLADGSLTLVSSAGALIPATPGASGMPYSNNMNYQATFTEDDMENQVVDPSKLEDIRFARD